MISESFKFLILQKYSQKMISMRRPVVQLGFIADLLSTLWCNVFVLLTGGVVVLRKASCQVPPRGDC